MAPTPRMLFLLAPLALVPACVPEPQGPAYRVQTMSFANSEWSAPVNLGATINTAANEQGPSLSKDGLTLYIGSDRTGGSGSFDLWIARRGCLDCSWDAVRRPGRTGSLGVAARGPAG